MAMTQEEVFNKVKEVLTAALAVDDDEVTREAKLREDLGAESIDFLDISFQLEKTFGIKIPKGDLMPENVFSNPEFVQNGKLTPKGLAEMKSRMTFADFTEFEKDPDINKIWDLFTVDALVRYVMTKVNV
ncbi:MAG: acyl carrier protein [Phycisphaerales bacterium]|nr:acyl carrier protein [Phycisphaerales bacterium]